MTELTEKTPDLMKIGNPRNVNDRRDKGNNGAKKAAEKRYIEKKAAKERFVVWLMGFSISFLSAMVFPLCKLFGGEIATLREFLSCTFNQSEIIFVCVALVVSMKNDVETNSKSRFGTIFKVLTIIMVIIGTIIYVLMEAFAYHEIEISKPIKIWFICVIFVVTVVCGSMSYILEICKNRNRTGNGGGK